MKTVAVTFAGRQDRMMPQVDFLREAIRRGVIDEWHVWNFARNESDLAWLDSTFGQHSMLLTDAQSTDYQAISDSASGGVTISVIARNDAHVLLTLASGELIELVFGAFGNTQHLLRCFSNQESYHPNAIPQAVRPGELLWRSTNRIELAPQPDGRLFVFLNQGKVFEIEASSPLDRLARIYVHTGYGSEGLWTCQPQLGPVSLINCAQRGHEGFKRVYELYSSAYFANNIFIKLDDDIVYCDVDQLQGFIQYVKTSDGVDLFSANVINNGVCAYLQSQKSYFPNLALEFEYPDGGFCGSLWDSSEKCQELHRYFLDNSQSVHERALSDREVDFLPAYDRFSINFVAFKQTLCVYMVAAYFAAGGKIDDEYLMTCVVPQLFGVRKVIYNRLLVAHLSFFKQDASLVPDDLVRRYRLLNARTN